MEQGSADGGTGVGDNKKKPAPAAGARPAKPKPPKPTRPGSPKKPAPSTSTPAKTATAASATKATAATTTSATKPSANSSVAKPPASKPADQPTVRVEAETATPTLATAATVPVAEESKVEQPSLDEISTSVEKPKRGIPNSALAMAAIVIGVGVGFLTYAFGSATDRTPTARVQMVLDEDQTGWPFYAAVQEEAAARVDNPATQDAVRSALSDPPSAGDLWIDRPGDLSVFAIYATADSDDLALEYANAAAAELQRQNLAQRREGEEATLAELESQLVEMEAEVERLAAELDDADDESVRVVAREDLRIVSADRADAQRSITDMTNELSAIGPAFRPAAPAAIQSTGSRSVLASIASAAAAAALTLLALSFVAPNREDS